MLLLSVNVLVEKYEILEKFCMACSGMPCYKL